MNKGTELYHQAPISDRPEMIQNRMHTQSMTLFNLITAELDRSGFTLQDVTENFNSGPDDRASANTKLIRYGKSHLDYLVSIGLLDFDETTNEYCVLRELDSFDHDPDE